MKKWGYCYDMKRAATSAYGRGKCKHSVAGRECTCQEWEPSGEDASLCDCCEHDMSFHEPRHPITSGYGRCEREIDDAGYAREVGCQEYFPRDPNSRTSAGCGCHKNFHTPVIGAVGELAGPSNVDSQLRDSLSSDSSTALVDSSGKVYPATVSRNVDDDGQARECGDGQKFESGVPVLYGTSIGDGVVQHEGHVEDGNSTDRQHLEPKHKVFLSHSGAQKDFVEQLCIDLERCDRYPFFDKRRTSLPVGLKFPQLLFAAIQQCEVGVVVLSEEFFTKTKWPMLELVEMVRVSKKLEASMNIVPVFFRISREECRKQETQDRWKSKWEEWAKTDKTINIDEWKAALKIFGSTTGLSLKDGEVQLRVEVVDAVCELVLPESRWDDSNVEGKDRLCKVILEKVKPRDSRVGVSVIGLHGVGGIGKTTICKVLCNKLYKEFRGRVCHTEMKSASEVELLRAVLKTLTDTKHDLVDGMNLDKCRDQLRRCIVRQPVFLAIDNVDEESTPQAKIYLEARRSFGRGSMVVVTARSVVELKALNIHEDDCLGMPELELLEAKTLFRNHATSIGDVKEELTEQIVSRCVELCCFKKGAGISHQYHPLALKVLGNVLREQLGCNNFDMKRWDANISGIEESYEFQETKKQIFSVLRISYDTLSREDQMLFMDVVLFLTLDRSPNPFLTIRFYVRSFHTPNMIEWLCLVHGDSREHIMKARLHKLKRKSLLEEVGDEWRDVTVHDLWREFCVAETEVGKFSDRRWIYVEGECKEPREIWALGRCGENVERMWLKGTAAVQKFLGLRLDHFWNVEVLKVEGEMTASEPVVVELGKLKHLTYLEVKDSIDESIDSGLTVENRDPLYGSRFNGLRLLANLAYLQWIDMADDGQYAEDIACLTNLRYLILISFKGSRLPDLAKLTFLQVATFYGISRVETIVGLSSKLRSLRILNVVSCKNLRSLPGVGDLIGLEILVLDDCSSLEALPNLGNLTNLKELNVSGCSSLEELPNLGNLTNLKELILSGCSSLRVCPSVCGLRYLRVMRVSCCSLLVTLPSLSDLVSLEEFDAGGCCNLAVLPDVRNLTKLRVLNIRGCRIRTVSGFEGLSGLRKLWASFGLLDWPDLHSLTSLRRVSIDGCSGPELTGITKHATLESLDVDECRELHLQLDLRTMERLQTLGFRGGDLKDMFVTNAFELWDLYFGNCDKLEVLDLGILPQLQELMLEGCKALQRLTCREPLVALRNVHRDSCARLEVVSDLSNFPGLEIVELND